MLFVNISLQSRPVVYTRFIMQYVVVVIVVVTVVVVCVHYRLLLGFMSTTGFLSMWISNTATAAMMLPIAQAVLVELRQETQSVQNSAIAGEEGRTMSDSNIVASVRYRRRSYGGVGSGEGENFELHEDKDTGRIHCEDQAMESGDAEMSSTGDSLELCVRPCVSAAAGSTMCDKSFLRLAKSLVLGIAYAANIGGTGSLTGTGPNIVLAGLARYVCCS